MIFELLHVQNSVHIHINLFAVSHSAQSFPCGHHFHPLMEID